MLNVEDDREAIEGAVGDDSMISVLGGRGE